MTQAKHDPVYAIMVRGVAGHNALGMWNRNLLPIYMSRVQTSTQIRNEFLGRVLRKLEDRVIR